MRKDRETETSSGLMVMAAKSSKLRPEEWLPFWMHSLDTAGILKKLLRRWVPQHILSVGGKISPEELEKVIIFLGLVHDIGKLTEIFQGRILPCIQGQSERLFEERFSFSKKYLYPQKTPHPFAGEAILLEYGCPKGISAVVGAHHGKPTDSMEELSISIECYEANYWGKQSEKWKALWKEWIDFSLQRAGYREMQELPELDMATQFLLSGLLIVGDWIASNTYYFPLISEDDQPTFSIYPERVNSAWKKLSFPDLWLQQSCSMDREDFCERFGFFPNAMQEGVLSILQNSVSPGLLIIEAQMGKGKTEAALAAAEILAARKGCGGVYFGLPSQATANGLFPRILNWADHQSYEENHSFALLHGASDLNQGYLDLIENGGRIGEDLEEGGVYYHRWFDGKKTGLLADFAVGTVDQILMAGLKKKHVMLRMLGLAGKVVIIDECHAYDEYMNGYLDRVLNWLGRYDVPVVLLSATLPQRRRETLVKAYVCGKDRKASEKIKVGEGKYPLLTWTDGLNVKQESVLMKDEEKRVYVDQILKKELYSVLEMKLSEGGCAGIVVNTVQYAQQLAAELRENLPGFDVILFHSKFTMADRAAIENDILRRVGKRSTPEMRDRLIVVGTQVLEQSLDVDFDFMVTQLCPMDLLLQRIGRLQRHAGRERKRNFSQAECRVLFGEEIIDEGSKKVYGEWLLHRTWKNLKKEIVIPGDIPLLVESVYGQAEDLTVEDRKVYEEYKNDLQKKREKAKVFCITEPKMSKFASRNTIHGMLDVTISEYSDAEAAVRDGEGTIEVILLLQEEDGECSLFPWQENRSFCMDAIPCKEDAMVIAKQKICLPGIFNYVWQTTVDELKAFSMREMPLWQESVFLRGELFLVMGKDFTVVLAGKRLRYSKEDGLVLEKEGVRSEERV